MSSTNNQFSIELPDDWEDATTYSFMGPEINGVQHLLTVSVDNEVGDEYYVDYARGRIEVLTMTLSGLEILTEEERTLENGTQYYFMACRWIPTDGRVLYQKYYYMIIDGVAYTFAGTFSKQSLKTIGRQVEQMINTFKPGAVVQSDE